MLFFSENTNGYRRIGLALLLCLLNVFIVGFPPFQTGIWVQSEPAVLALFTGAALSGVWLGIGVFRRRLVILPAIPPIILTLLAWIAWQCLMTATAQLPLRSWFGPPQTGDGTGMSVVILIMIWLVFPLWQIASMRRIILLTTTASLIVQCALHFYYPEIPGNPYMPERWIPAQWPEYLPFLGGYLWVAAFASRAVKTKKHYALCILAMPVLLVDSHNRSAVALFPLALGLTTLAHWLPGWFKPNRLWKSVMLIACVLPFSLVLISPIFPAPGSDQASSGKLAIFSRINDGIGSRMLLDRVGMSALQHEPQRLVIGNGWGTYTDDLFKYGLVDGIYTYKNGVRAPNWFLVDGTSHHSHNQPLEALLSLGLIGLLLWYAIPMLALWTLPDTVFWTCAPMIAALTGLGHFWFQLPQCFPYQALYLAALVSLSSPCRGEAGRGALLMALLKKAPTLTLPLLGRGCFLITIIMAASAFGQYRAMAHADQVHHAITTGSYKDHNEDWLDEDLRYGGDRWATSARFYSGLVFDKAAKHPSDDNTLGWYGYFLHNAHNAAQSPTIAARASAVELRLCYYLFDGLKSSNFNALRQEASETIENAVMTLMRKAPLRDDFTTPFLIDLPKLTHNDTAREIQILEHMLAIAPSNRGVLWTLGHLYLATPDKQGQGRAMVQQALATHVETVFPLSDAQLQKAY